MQSQNTFLSDFVVAKHDGEYVYSMLNGEGDIKNHPDDGQTLSSRISSAPKIGR